MSTDKSTTEEMLCHPERVFCAKDLCNSSVSSVPSVVEALGLDPRKSVAERF
jgi:hypothetical protein